MGDITVTIDGTVADALTSDPFTFQYGSTAQLDLRFEPNPNVVDSFETRHDTLLGYLEYANTANLVTGRTDNGTPRFREPAYPTNADVDTLVVDVQTGADLTVVDEVWGLVIGGEDLSPPHGGGSRSLRLDLFLVARLSEYATAQDVTNAHGSPLV